MKSMVSELPFKEKKKFGRWGWNGLQGKKEEQMGTDLH